MRLEYSQNSAAADARHVFANQEKQSLERQHEVAFTQQFNTNAKPRLGVIAMAGDGRQFSSPNCRFIIIRENYDYSRPLRGHCKPFGMGLSLSR